eukprot:m.42292 g.42292  ORF g.42292 m.42292 type:complete len:486 (+) comp11904_c0_seq6:92-1549(+)
MARAISADEHADVSAVCWPFAFPQAQHAWFMQGFEFSSSLAGDCFFIQHKNGPCGVLAAIQGLVIQELLWPSDDSPAQPLAAATSASIRSALVQAITFTLLQSSEKGGTCLVVRGQASQQTFMTTDEFLAAVEPQLLEFNDADELKDAVAQHLDEFIGCGGVVQYLYSLILTCGLDRVRQAMQGINSLIYEDSTCDHILVNLILTGIPKEGIDDDAWASWSGMPRLGFLTTEQEFIPAVRFLNPLYPIWVSHCGGHYTLIYGTDPDLLQHAPPSQMIGPAPFNPELGEPDSQSQDEVRSASTCAVLPSSPQDLQESGYSPPPLMSESASPTQQDVVHPQPVQFQNLEARLQQLPDTIASRSPCQSPRPETESELLQQLQEDNSELVDDPEFMEALRLSLQTPSAVDKKTENYLDMVIFCLLMACTGTKQSGNQIWRRLNRRILSVIVPPGTRVFFHKQVLCHLKKMRVNLHQGLLPRHVMLSSLI